MKLKTFFLTILTIFFIVSCKKNKLKIKSNNNKILKDLKITLNDNMKKHYVIYENKSYNSIPNIYGENDWNFFYKNKLIFDVRHFKTNKNNAHKYFFNLKSTKDSIYLNMEVLGINNLELKRKVSLGNLGNGPD